MVSGAAFLGGWKDNKSSRVDWGCIVMVALLLSVTMQVHRVLTQVVVTGIGSTWTAES